MKLSLTHHSHQLAYMILNFWDKPIEKLDLSNCNLQAFPSLPSSHCATIKEIDLSGFYKNSTYLFFQKNNLNNLKKKSKKEINWN